MELLEAWEAREGRFQKSWLVWNFSTVAVVAVAEALLRTRVSSVFKSPAVR